MRVLIAVPVFNEERYVAGVIGEILRYAPDVLVIDDGSTDRTAGILRGVEGISVIHHPENRGYGQSLIDAFAYADCHGYDWIITIDCDDQHEPRQIPEFIERAARCNVDIISGSRYLTSFAANTQAPHDRREINGKITAMLNERLKLGITDAFCGFKAYRVEAMQKLCLNVPGYAFPMQFWVQAWRQGLRICEIAVPLIYNDPTRHFGGILDDPESRLDHYMQIFEREMIRSSEASPALCSVRRCP
ncbi:MAG TPA: glycosyltransferase family 2 protein [Phycisphaerae bacterium]|nr:glycosyltransferase family 2 protein [Phycisphaerae bacterium]